MHNNYYHRVLESLNQFIDAVAVNGTEDRTVFGYSTYALQVQNIDSVKVGGHALTVNLGSVDEALNSGQISKENLVTGESLMSVFTNATASVYVPTDSLINNVSPCTLEMLNTSQQRLSHSVFLSDILFQSHFRNNSRIGSIIIAARIQCLDGVFLPMPIRTTFRTNPTVIIYIHHRILGLHKHNHALLYYRLHKIQAIECALVGTQVRCTRDNLYNPLNLTQLLKRNMVNKRLY